MSMSKSERRTSDSFRMRVRQMLAAGYSVSRIAKETGKSHTHAKRIAEQERAELAKDGGA